MSEFKWPLMKNSISLRDRIKLAQFVLTSDKFTQGRKVEEFEGRNIMNKFGNLIDGDIKETINEVLSSRELPNVEYA